MLRRMPSSLLTEWMAYARLEPWGEERADLRAGIIASVMANIHRAKGQKTFKPRDFMPVFDRPKQTANQMLRYVEMLNQMFGGKDLRRAKRAKRD